MASQNIYADRFKELCYLPKIARHAKDCRKTKGGWEISLCPDFQKCIYTGEVKEPKGQNRCNGNPEFAYKKEKPTDNFCDY